MPAPHAHPAPISRSGSRLPSGSPPALMACRSKKNACIMFLATWPVTNDEVAALDAASGVEIDLCPLDRRPGWPAAPASGRAGCTCRFGGNDGKIAARPGDDGSARAS